MDDFEVLGRIVVDSSGASSLQMMNGQMGEMEKRGASMSGGFSKLGMAASMALGNIMFSAISKVTQGISDFASSIVEATNDAQKTLAQTNAVLASTKGISGMTAQSVEALGVALSKTSTFEVDTVKKSENLLLTFTQIGKDVFPSATQATLDMATALGEDVTSAAMQLGKALNDPIKGVGALRRVGVQLTDEQKAQVEQMVRVGDVAGAQKVILAELATEFGGSASAAANTYAGRMEQLKNRMTEFKEAVGGAVLPIIQGLTERVIAFVDSPAVEALGKNVVDLFSRLGGAISNVFSLFGGGGGGNIEDVVMMFSRLVRHVSDFLAALSNVKSLPDLMKMLFPSGMGALSGLQGVGTAVGNLVGTVSKDGPKFKAMFGDMFSSMKTQVASAMPGILGNFKGAIDGLTKLWRNHGDEIMAVIRIAWKVIVQVVVGAAQILGGIINAIVAIVSGLFDIISDLVHGNWQKAWDDLVGTIMQVKDILIKTLGNLVDGIAKMLGTSWDNIVATWKDVWRLFKLILTEEWENIKTSVHDHIQGMIDKIKQFKDSLVQSGKDFILGFLNGIINKATEAIDVIKGVIKKIIKAIQEALGATSPAKVMIPIGAAISEGLSVGMVKASVQPIAAAGGVVTNIVNAASAAAGGAGGIAGGSLGGVTINIYDARDPDAVARRVWAEINSRMKVQGVIPLTK